MNLRYASPRYWPTWCGVAALWCVVRLPLAVQWRLGVALGWLGLRCARRRRHIAAVNLRLCFPALDDGERAALLAATFRSTGIAVLETALAWLRPPARLADQVTITGTEHIADALRQGRGLLMIGGHFATLDIAGALLARVADFAVTYRPSSNPLIEHIMRRARQRLSHCVFPATTSLYWQQAALAMGKRTGKASGRSGVRRQPRCSRKGA